MAYSWTYTIATGTAILAAAYVEMQTNVSAELTARSTSYAWPTFNDATAGVATGNYIRANHTLELRAACDLASASTTCSVDNASYDSTVNSSANDTADSTKNNTVDTNEQLSYDSSEDTSVDGTADSSYDWPANVAVDEPEYASVNNSN